MFSGLTTLFFGSQKQETSELPKNSSTPHLNTQAHSLKTLEDDDGWIVVSDKKENDKREEEYCDLSDEDLDANMSISFDSYADTINGVANLPDPSPSPSVHSPTPSTPTSLTQVDSDSSWYLTPPPCFTAGTSSTEPHFVSPMENLLIEHPSMSVYHQREEPAGNVGSCLSLPPPSKDGTTVKRAKPSKSRDVVIQNSNDAVPKKWQRPRRASPSVAPRAGLFFAQIFTNEIKDKHLQMKQEVIHRSKNLHRNQLERNNKVKEVNASGKKTKRKDKMKTPSGMNNNRKC